MKYVTCMDAIWRLSDAAYKRLLKSAAQGNNWDLDDYGKCICDYLIRVTDMDADEAKQRLEELKP